MPKGDTSSRRQSTMPGRVDMVSKVEWRRCGAWGQRHTLESTLGGGVGACSHGTHVGSD